AYLNGYHRFQVPTGALVSARVSVLARERRPDLEAVVPVIYEKTIESWRDVGEHLERHEGQAVLFARGERFPAAAEELVAKLLPRLEDDADAVYFASRAEAALWDETARGLALEEQPPEAELTSGPGAAAARPAAPLRA